MQIQIPWNKHYVCELWIFRFVPKTFICRGIEGFTWEKKNDNARFKIRFKADCVGGDVMMNSKKWLNDNGFIVRHIRGDWYLVRLYGDKRNPLHHIIFPMKIVT